MTKHTLRNALRNTVINETVNNLTQAICNQWTARRRPDSGPGHGPFSLVAYADTELFYGQAEHRAAAGRRPSISSPRTWTMSRTTGPHGSRNGCEVSSRRRITSSSRRRRPSGRPISPRAVDPLEELGDHVARRDFARIAQLQASSTATTPGQEGRGTSHGPGDRTSGPAQASREHLSSLALQDSGRGHQPPAQSKTWPIRIRPSRPRT